ncbi:hypothetical protein SDC9_66447 [bioreactor metagenome]|uniref:Uncharacterized protein n=1 Tax=bioreactor metagenome TaxID=1076179 RepID=A0A644XUY1_9ZZZZ
MPGVDDRGGGPARGAQHDHRAVEVAAVGELRVEVLAGRGDLGDVTEEEPRGVEVVDGHVLEDAAGLGEVRLRRGGRVAGDDRQLLERADRALLDQGAGPGEGRVEPAVEAEHHRDVGQVGELALQLLGVGQLHRHRLLAQRGLAGPHRGEDVLDVQRGGGADHHRVDVLGGEHVGGIRAGPRAVRRGDRLGRGGHRVTDQGEGRCRVRRDGAGVDLADTAGPDQSETQLGHACSSSPADRLRCRPRVAMTRFKPLLRSMSTECQNKHIRWGDKSC